MCISSKIKKCVEISKEEIEKGNCIVIGIQSTGESNTKAALNNASPEKEIEGFICGPKEIYKRFIESFYKLPAKPHEKKLELIDEMNNDIERAIKNSSPSQKGFKDIETYIKDLKCDECKEECDINESLLCYHCGKHICHLKCINEEYNGDSDLRQWFCVFCKHFKETDCNYSKKYLEHVEFYNRIRNNKSKILSDIEEMKLPQNPLDILIDELGGVDKVAEMTGRSQRLIRTTIKLEDGREINEYKYVNRLKDDNITEKNAFMSGKKLIAIISDATSTGISLQSDKKCENQRKRVHITLELAWSATKAIQQLGRTHRSNQLVPPSYVLLLSNIGGEIRFAFAISNRLQQLGALTMGTRYATGGFHMINLSIDNKNGNKALKLIGNILLKKEKAPVNCRILDDINKPIDDKTIRRMSDFDFDKYIPKLREWLTDMDIIEFNQENLLKRYFNRLLCQEFEVQSQLLCYFYDILHYINEKEALNSPIDNGILMLSGNNIHEISREIINIHNTGNLTTLISYSIDLGIDYDEIKSIYSEHDDLSFKNGFYKLKDGNDYIYAEEYDEEDINTKQLKMKYNIRNSKIYKCYTPITGLVHKPIGEDDFNLYQPVTDLDEVEKYWRNEYTRSETECIHHNKCRYRSLCQLGRRHQTYHILSGSFLFIWSVIYNKLQEINYFDKKVRIVRIKGNDDNGTIGIKLPEPIVEDVIKSLKDTSNNIHIKNEGDIPMKRPPSILQTAVVKRKVVKRLKPLHQIQEKVES